MTSMKTTTGLIRIRVKSSHLGPADLYLIVLMIVRAGSAAPRPSR